MRGCLWAILALMIGAAPVHAAERRFMVTDFERIDIGGPHVITVVTGRPQGVKAIGDSAALDRLKVTVHSRRLRIAMDKGNGWDWSKATPLRIEISAHRLSGITLSGSAMLDVDQLGGDVVDLHVAGSAHLAARQIKARTLDLSLSGRGSMTLNGHCDTARITLNGAGSIDAGALTCKDVTSRLYGSGQLEIRAEQKATLAASGAGDIHILGGADCKVTQSGAGLIRCGTGD